MSRRTLETLIALVVIAALFYLLMVKVILVKEIQRPAPPRTFEPAVVETRILEAGVDVPAVELSGSLAPLRRVAISAEVGGRVVRVLEDWHPGRTVAADELLFAVDAEPLELTLASARARLTEATAAKGAAAIEVQSASGLLPVFAEAVEVANREHARLSGLVATGESSASMVDAALAAVVQARLAEQNGRAAHARAVAAAAVADATEASAKAAVKQAEEALRHTEFHAPFAGTLTADGPEVGELLAPGGSLIAAAGLGELVDLSTLRLLAQAHESLLVRIAIGAAAKVELPSAPGLTLDGRVVRLAPLADPLTRNVTVEILVSQPQGRTLAAGLSARAIIAPPADPTAAMKLFIKRGEFLWSEGGTPTAFIANGQGADAEATPTELQLGPALGEGFVVLKGLRAGDRLITGPLDRLNEEAATPITLHQP